MYNLSNSPNGPLGQAGMASGSTMPQGLTANAPATFNNFGKGIENFYSGLGDKASGLWGRMFGGLFGGDGGLLGGKGTGVLGGGTPTPRNLTNGVQSIFGQPGQPGAQGSPMVGNPIANATAEAGAPSIVSTGDMIGAPSGGGFLSRFMGGGR
jgi:hypothetical protein